MQGDGMPQFVFSAPADITAEDEVTIETEIRVRSVVTIQRKGPNSVSIIAIADSDEVGR
jgi:hypothetical protein